MPSRASEQAVLAFFDTNILVYALDERSGERQRPAYALLEQHLLAGTLVISTQVLQECYSVLTRKIGFPPERAIAAMTALAEEPVVASSAAFVLRAMATAHRSQLSMWDALIVEAALDAGCSLLFTEDLQHGQRFDALTVVNPFLPTAHEPPARYGAAAVPATGNPRRGRRAASIDRR